MPRKNKHGEQRERERTRGECASFIAGGGLISGAGVISIANEPERQFIKRAPSERESERERAVSN